MLNENFWQSVVEIMELSEPIVSSLRLVDGVVPCVGKIYWKMHEIDVGLMNSSLTEYKKNALRMIVNNRWKMMHSDLHAAVLDPEYRSFHQHKHAEVMEAFHAVIKRVHSDDVSAQVRAIHQHSDYCAGHGLFARPLAMAAAKKCQHTDGGYLSVCMYQICKKWLRVLSQVSSASACDRNWSTFDFIHSKKKRFLYLTVHRIETCSILINPSSTGSMIHLHVG